MHIITAIDKIWVYPLTHTVAVWVQLQYIKICA